jgi:hypothetical protein
LPVFFVAVCNPPCLIQVQETLGIIPTFWKDEASGPRELDILPISRLDRASV